MITNQIAIGDANSPYDLFDVIVNLNYPHNGATHHAIHTLEEGNRVLYNVGLDDRPSEPIEALIVKLIPQLIMRWHNNPNIKILFHCHAGVSQSPTIAIAYIAHLYGLSTQDAYHIVKSKRPIAPNTGFMNTIK